MVLRGVLLVMLAGCGRLGIDALAVEDAPIAPPIDAHDLPIAVVAHSMQDFDTLQGAHGWYYGCWDITHDSDGVYTASDFEPMVLLADAWRPADWVDMPDPHYTWAYLLGWGGHPGSYPIERAVIRRWISPVAGAAIIRVTHAKADGGGDGTRAMLVVDGVTVLSRDVAGEDFTGFVQDVPVTLAPGSTVDLLLHFIGDDAVDSTTQAMDILPP